MDELRRLTTDNPTQQRRLDMLDSRAVAAVEYAAAMVAARRQTNATPQLAALMENKNRVDAVRASIQEMQAEEERLLTERAQASRASRRVATWITTGGCCWAR